VSEQPVIDISTNISSSPQLVSAWSAATKHWLPAVVLLLVTVVLWEAAVRIFAISSFIIPAPTKIAQALVAQWGVLMRATAVTAGEILFGFLVSVMVGVVLALVIVRFDWLGRALYPLVVLFQNVPKVALAPIFILWFGYGLVPKVGLILVIAFFPVTLSMLAGMQSVDQLTVGADELGWRQPDADSSAGPRSAFTAEPDGGNKDSSDVERDRRHRR